MMLGYMPMPLNFKYRDVFLKGMPHHERWDSFLLRHPPMPASRWAKIFSPFDALKGFSEAVASKEVQYVDRQQLDEDEQRELDRKLSILQNLTWNGSMARANQVMVSVTYFVPCADEQSFAFLDHQGQYQTITGMVLNVDAEVGETITLKTDTGKTIIDFCDIQTIESQKADLFDLDWEAP